MWVRRNYFFLFCCSLAFLGLSSPDFVYAGVSRQSGSPATPTTPTSQAGKPDVANEKSAADLPGKFDLIVKKIAEAVDLAFTFDPAEDAKKRAKYASDNLATGYKMLQESDDPDVEEQAVKLIERSEKLLSDVAKNKPNWSAKGAAGEEVEKLVSDFSDKHQKLLSDDTKLAKSEAHAAKLKAAKAKGEATLGDLGKAIKDELKEGAADTPVPSEAGLKPLPYLSLEEFLKKVSADKDRDGIPDEEEKKLGTSNADFDTDGDALSDQSELLIYGTDPKNPDTDGDGYRDGLEVLKGFNPKGTGKMAGN